MGTLPGDDGGDRPADGALPDLPPDWGPIVIPDDPAELAAEAEQLRAELREAARRSRWWWLRSLRPSRRSTGRRWSRRSRADPPTDNPISQKYPPERTREGSGRAGPSWRVPGPRQPFDDTDLPQGSRLPGSASAPGGSRPGGPGHRFPLDHGRPGLRTPLIIMFVAVFVTMLSLFAIGWTGLRPRPRTPDTIATGSALLPIALTDPAGAEVRIRDLLPAVLLLLDSCPCESLVSVTVNATAPEVNVLRIVTTPSGGPTALPAGPTARRFRLLLDPQQAVRGALPDLRQLRGPTAVLVERDASTVRIVPDITTSDQFLHDLHTFTK